MQKNKEKRAKRIRIVTLAVFILVSIAAGIFAFVYYKKSGTQSIEEMVSGLGVRGVAFMLLCQTAQVVFAIIPGEPLELLAGVLYGTWGGVLLCSAGVAIGTVIIFLLVKFWGGGFLMNFADSDKFGKLKFLKNPEKRDLTVFILMFIPGTPKDLLTYFAPFTGMKLKRFIIISALARIPSIISSTYVGSTASDGNYLRAGIVFAAVGIVSVTGIVIYNKIVERKNKDGNKDN